MAKTNHSGASSVEELDDMVYVSDREDKEDQKEPVVEAERGMIPAVKNLYHGERDDRGRFTATDKVPEDLPEPEETEETGRYALLIRNNKCYDGRKSLSIASIVIQSPLLKKVLCWVLQDYPCMAPELDRLEIVSPFRPFVHRWQRLTDALHDEPDPETKSHIQLFYDALKKELEVTLEARDDFITHKTITFNSLWMLFEPGDVVFTKLNKRPVAAKLISSGVFPGRHEDLYRLECEMIYGNGKMFGWGNPRFSIPEFDGMSKITDLCVYPLKCHPKVDKVTEQLIENGKAYERLMGFHHVQYQGIALNGHQPFYVDSRIVLDPDAYKCYNPDHDLVLKPLKKTKATRLTNAAMADSDSEGSDDSSDEDECDTDSIGKAKKKPAPALTNDQLLLCGSSVKGYSLRNKRWLDFFVDNIKDIAWHGRAWDNVVLDKDLKDLIYAMIDGHLKNHKGLLSKGLNILLSGPSGIGKTYTVESVAEALRVPLFHITPADVDLDAKDPDLESPFTDVLEMCGRWNAMLLFDQAQGSLDNDRFDDDQPREYSLLLDALESHSAALFVTCDAVAEDCMDERLQSRFHVCLQLPELTSATRGQIWQKSLEAQKDFSFFANPDVLANWTLNGREIANAVTAAKTLATNGVIEMKHLERVVPAGKKPIPFEDDVWDFAPKKEKKKSKKPTPDVIEIVEEPPRKVEDDWDSWGSFGTKKEKKGKKKASTEPSEIAPPAVAPEPVPEEDFGWGSFGTKKEKKAKEKAPIVSSVAAEPAVAPEPVPQEDPWDSWGLKKKEKKPKKPEDFGFFEPPPPPPAVEEETPTKDVCEPDDSWGFGGKKKKDKKATSKEAEPLVPPKVEESGEPVPPVAPAAEIDDWAFWGSSKKSKKSKKKAVIDDDAFVIPEELPSSTEPTSSRPPPPMSCVGCRTCVEYQPVVEGHSCKRCGTHEGTFKVVCESCAPEKGYNQFALSNVPCGVCGILNP